MLLLNKTVISQGNLLLSYQFQIPASAVEMPGHIGSFQLDVQFGNLDFGSDSGLTIGADKTSTSYASTAGR